MPLERVTIE